LRVAKIEKKSARSRRVVLGSSPDLDQERRRSPMGSCSHENDHRRLPGVAAPDLAPALPWYLQRLLRLGVRVAHLGLVFDHQPIINSILFGNYRRIMRNTLRMMDPKSAGRTLQIAAVLRRAHADAGVGGDRGPSRHRCGRQSSSRPRAARWAPSARR
jgi:hypothetical protein